MDKFIVLWVQSIDEWIGLTANVCSTCRSSPAKNLDGGAVNHNKKRITVPRVDFVDFHRDSSFIMRWQVSPGLL